MNKKKPPKKPYTSAPASKPTLPKKRPRAGNRLSVTTAGQPATPACRARARELYDSLGAQWAEISRRLKEEGHKSCEPKTIYNWSKAENWEAQNIASAPAPAEAARLPHKAKRRELPATPPPGATASQPAQPSPPANLEAHRTKRTNLEHVRVAIEQVVLSISDARHTQDLRAIGSLATALCKLIELEGKLAPSTAAGLAARAIELGLDPEQFVETLAEQWRIHKAS